MHRNRLITGSIVVIALTMASCGDSGSKTPSADDFVSQMNTICRTADRAIGKLDTSDKSYTSDVSDVIQTGLDDFAKLKAPKALAGDFADYTANLDDQLSQFEKLTKAIKSNDTGAITKASDKLTKLSADSDDLAKSIGADRCVGVGNDATVTTDSTPGTTKDTTPDTTKDTTVVTTKDTTVETITPNTPLPIDTTVNTVPVTTSGGTTGTAEAKDATAEFAPPPGYTWGSLEDISQTATPASDPVLGPILDTYFVGVLNNDDTGAAVYIYITALTQKTPWTQPQLTAYYNFELVGDGGTDITTPTLGLPGRAKADAVTGYDGALFTIKGFGVSILAPTGTNVPALLDAFASAQATMGG